VFSVQIFQENTFLETKPNFPLTGKYFPLTNFSNDKQTQESLENNFLKTIFQKTNIALIRVQSFDSVTETPRDSFYLEVQDWFCLRIFMKNT